MTYGDIIRNNVKLYPWSKYAYHFTDVTNAVNILAEGRLYSRNKVLDKGLMANDNASEKVIAYNDCVTNYVRFYFRPKTPTQFYNEGYKHPAFRFEGNKNANITVPVFFLLDLESMLESGQVSFSAMTLAGYNPSPIFNGIQKFAALPFEKIYSSPYDKENKNFRHAELICRDEFVLEPFLQKIVCRNQIERATLNCLLYEKKPALFGKYKNLINSDENDSLDLFERNGLFVEKIFFDEESNLHVKFSNSSSKRYYDSRQNFNYNSAEVKVTAMIGKWIANAIHWRSTLHAKINYCSPTDFIVPHCEVFDSMIIKVFLDVKVAAFCLINL